MIASTTEFKPTLTRQHRESAVIFALVHGTRHTQAIRETLAGCNWENPLFGAAYQAICHLQDTDDPAARDATTLVPALVATLSGQFQRGKVLSTLADCMSENVLTETSLAAAAELCELSRANNLAELANNLMRWLDRGIPPDDIIPQVHAALDGLRVRETSSHVDVHQAAQSFLENIQAERTRPIAHFGIPSLDEVSRGMRPSYLTVLAARPSGGKSALGLQTAEWNASQDRPVLFVSLEMSLDQVMERFMARRLPFRFRQRLTPSQCDRFQQAARELQDMPLSLWAPPRATVPQIKSKAKLVAAQEGRPLALVVVDYLQITEPLDTKPNRVEQCTEIARGLKAMAKELDFAVLALCQLSRAAEGQTPRMSHLRESGSIEQEADQVIMLSDHDGGQDDWLVDCTVGKNRNDPVGRVVLRFVPQETRFEGGL